MAIGTFSPFQRKERWSHGNLLHHKCENSPVCPSVFVDDKVPLIKHQLTCEHRRYPCPLWTCPHTMTLDNTLKHLDDVHRLKPDVTSTLPIFTDGLDTAVEEDTYALTCPDGGQTYLLKIQEQAGNLQFWCLVLDRTCSRTCSRISIQGHGQRICLDVKAFPLGTSNGEIMNDPDLDRLPVRLVNKILGTATWEVTQPDNCQDFMFKRQQIPFPMAFGLILLTAVLILLAGLYCSPLHCPDPICPACPACPACPVQSKLPICQVLPFYQEFHMCPGGSEPEAGYFVLFWAELGLTSLALFLVRLLFAWAMFQLGKEQQRQRKNVGKIQIVLGAMIILFFFQYDMK